MSLFTMPMQQIEFEHVKAFCEEWAEGVSVEYKKEAEPKTIAKTVSAFANWQGGVFIIGVKADKKNNKAMFPITGIPNKVGREEAIMQSAATRIYPRIMPEVAVVHTEKEDHVVVVVRVEESLLAPHAMQNSNEVYIRTGSVSHPYKLADMDRIQYMLRRREDSTIVYGQIIKRMEDRMAKYIDPDHPSITAIARPVFPYKPIISTREVYDFMRREIDRSALSRVPGGAFYWTSPDNSIYLSRWEMNDHGIVYGNRSLLRSLPIENPDTIHHIRIYEFVKEFFRCIAPFYATCGYRGNIELSLHLRDVAGKSLIYAGDGHNPFSSYASYICRDSEIFASTRFPSESLVKSDWQIGRLPRDSSIRIDRPPPEMPDILSIFQELIDQILWAFDIDRTPSET